MQLIFNFFWRNKILFYLTLVAGCVVAFSPADAGIQPKGNDKVLHLVGFFIMAGLCHLSHPKLSYWPQITGLAGFGIAIEWVQSYLPSRQFSLADWAADIAGILLYFLIVATPTIRFLRNRYALD